MVLDFEGVDGAFNESFVSTNLDGNTMLEPRLKSKESAPVVLFSGRLPT